MSEQPNRAINFNSHASTIEDIASVLEVDRTAGLSSDEVLSRRRRYGVNKLKQVERESLITIFLRQFKSLIMAVLAAAAGLSFAFKEWIDGIGIVAAIGINAGIGFFTEYQAIRSMEALQEMDTKYCRVVRDGKTVEVNAEEVVPGDLVALEGGDLVPADIRVTEANHLQVDESALTGESLPVKKDTDVLEADTPLAERKNMVFKGTAIIEGSGFGIAVGTGMNTELGSVASLVEESQSEEDPLKKRLDRLASILVKAIIGVAAVAAVVGIIAGKELFLMIETSVALFVAAVPEGLPIVATLALARGMHRMAKRNALVRRLQAVQTLGSTNVIFTDKTGTLTENRMTVTVYLFDGFQVDVSGQGLDRDGEFLIEGETVDPRDETVLTRALRVGGLCNNASVDEQNNAVGDPMEVALLIASRKAGLDKEIQDEDPHGETRGDTWVEMREVAFDPEVKMMATFHNNNALFYEAVKGAPAAVLERSTAVRLRDGSTREITEEDRRMWREKNEELAGNGLRVLALAEREVDDFNIEPYHELVFLGLVGLSDPPRREIKQAVEICQNAGIRVIMITGDQQPTAAAVGKEVGIADAGSPLFHGERLKAVDALTEEEKQELLDGAIFYRVAPEQKLNLISLHQDAGSIVAMTGDGVNDAPALKKADIGVAMGKRGEPVAEDASDMILQDDRFATIPVAIEGGRIIFDNIRKFVLYMISGNVGEILIVMLATLVGAPLPLLPLQILYINAVNDIFPALALGVGKGSSTVMKRPPRDPSEPILTGKNWIGIGLYGLLIGVSVLAGFALGLTRLGWSVDRAVTCSFLSIAFARLWHVFNMREHASGFFRNEVTRNPFVWGALLLCIVLLLAAVYISPVATVLKVVDPGVAGWALIVAVSLVPVVVGQIVKTFLRKQCLV